MNTSTYTNTKYEPLTLDDVKKAVDSLPKPIAIIERIEICRKHWKELEKHTEIKDCASDMWGHLSGIQVIIKPYLKKVKLYYKVNV